MDDGATVIADSIAICKYLARTGADADGLMGRSAYEQIKVEQYLSFANSQVRPIATMIAQATFGLMQPFHDEYMDAIKALKTLLGGLNKRLAAGKAWLLGDQCTIADIYLAGVLIVPF